jgi:bifunctional DNA-binding transcriptional regulator/antitoxin component of YhaV-PrlF toxin-antitoxin module
VTETATLSSKYQISIPKAIRTAQHWEAGLTFAFIPKGCGVLLIPVPERQALKGLAAGASTTDYRDHVANTSSQPPTRSSSQRLGLDRRAF